jgi:hypothetical protein
VIIRILGEGQYDVSAADMDALQDLDKRLEAAVSGDDDEVFRTALTALLQKVREIGKPVPDEELAPSDAILPAEDAHVDDVRELLTDEGVIPG